MNYNRPVKNDSTMLVMSMCAVVFLLFSFLWLYAFQADYMYVLQHTLSAGRTQYSRLPGALLITAALWLLQLVVYGITRLRKKSHALTWFPSMLVLAVLSSSKATVDGDIHLGLWWWLLPLLLVLWVLILLVARTIQPYEEQVPSGLFSRCMWVNMFTMALLMIGVAVCANTHAVTHYRAHAEVALLHGDADEALRVGERSLETDSSLTMVRMYALSRQHQLGERLFEYALTPTSDAMLPTTRQVHLMIYPVDSIYRHLGAIPRQEMRPMDYLRLITRHHQAKAPVADYLICGYLLDRNLDAFARQLQQTYSINDSLPRYYREALVLYNHRSNNPLIEYRDEVLDVDFADYQKMKATYQMASERRGRVMEHYANSYWYYYDFVGH